MKPWSDGDPPARYREAAAPRRKHRVRADVPMARTDRRRAGLAGRCATTWNRSTPSAAGSVRNTDQALRSFATFLHQHHPEITLDQVARTRGGYKPWLAAARATTAGVERDPRAPARDAAVFFVRIDEWGWDEAQPGYRCSQRPAPPDHPLPKALGDPTAAKLLLRPPTTVLVRVCVEVLLRTGLRVSECVALPADAVVCSARCPVHVPVGKLRDDRYLRCTRPGRPHRHLPEHLRRPGQPAALPRSGAPPTNSVTRILNHAAGRPGSATSTTSCASATGDQSRHEHRGGRRHVGHYSLDMTLRYVRSRTGPSPMSTSRSPKVDALYAQAGCRLTPSANMIWLS